jgi:hypothetical protein
MQDERLAISLAPLPFMQALSVLDRNLRLWQRARKLKRARPVRHDGGSLMRTRKLRAQSSDPPCQSRV